MNLDTYVIVSRRPDEPTARRIEDAHDATAAAHGIAWDYVRERLPQTAGRPPDGLPRWSGY